MDITSLYRFPLLPYRGVGLSAAAQCRAEYLAQFKQQAPPWNPARRMKVWRDQSVADKLARGEMQAADPVEYLVFDDRAGALVKMSVPASEAATYNIPGAYDYPAWVPTPTQSTIDGQPIAPHEICTRAEAEAISAEIGGSGVVESESNATWRDERRYFDILWRGTRVRAAKLIQQRVNKGPDGQGGVGWPGKWDLTGPVPRWVQDFNSDHGVYSWQINGGQVPVPCRPLAPGEAIQRVGLTAAWEVVQVKPIIVPPPSDGGASGEVLTALARIEANQAIMMEQMAMLLAR
jgi:hypothetical protein